MTFSSEFIQEQKDELIKEKEELKKGIEKIAKKEPEGEENYEPKHPEYGRAPEENADEEERFLAEADVENSIENHLREIDNALDKIEKGTYGICSKCGQEIDEKRLKAYPSAAICAKH